MYGQLEEIFLISCFEDLGASELVKRNLPLQKATFTAFLGNRRWCGIFKQGMSQNSNVKKGSTSILIR